MTSLPDPDYQAEFYAFTAPKRLVAWFIDSLLIVILCLITVVLTAFVGLIIWPLLYLVIGFVYRAATLTSSSATLGMRFAGIELRDLSGRRLDSQKAIMHSAGFTFSMAIPVLQVISIIMMLANPKGQGLSDALLGTVMLNRRA